MSNADFIPLNVPCCIAAIKMLVLYRPEPKVAKCFLDCTRRSVAGFCSGTAFSSHQTFRRNKAAAFKRRMRKTARPVLWEGDGGAIPVTRPDHYCLPQLASHRYRPL
jgi:hypothetical protein